MFPPTSLRQCCAWQKQLGDISYLLVAISLILTKQSLPEVCLCLCLFLRPSVLPSPGRGCRRFRDRQLRSSSSPPCASPRCLALPRRLALATLWVAYESKTRRFSNFRRGPSCMPWPLAALLLEMRSRVGSLRLHTITSLTCQRWPPSPPLPPQTSLARPGQLRHSGSVSSRLLPSPRTIASSHSGCRTRERSMMSPTLPLITQEAMT